MGFGKYESKRVQNLVMQSAVPKRKASDEPFNPKGLLVRGVVTATYVLDDASHPIANQSNYTPVAVYCDVLCYTNIPGTHLRGLTGCLVLQDRGAMHSGRIWKPRAATLDITGDALNSEEARNSPADLDGDHVLVGFMDNALNVPVILGGLPHPNADLGNESLEIGQRKRLKLADGDPDFFRHHGSFYGISDTGDFVIDLRKATNGPTLESDGKEPAPPEDGSVGNYIVKLPAESSVHIEIDGVANTLDFDGTKLELKLDSGATLKAELKDGDAKLTVGDGAKKVAIADYLKTMWQDFANTKFPAHTHVDGFGGTGPVNSGPITAWDPAIESTKVKIPDT